MVNLLPKDLIYFKVPYGDRTLKVLLDSGATSAIISRGIVELPEGQGDQTKHIVGLADTEIKTGGVATIELEILEHKYEVKGLIVNKEDILYDVVLGLDFLRENKFKVDMNQRKVSIVQSDQSVISYFLDEENNIKRRVYEKIPVYATEQTKFKRDEETILTVEFQDVMPDEDEMYFEGKNFASPF